MAHLSLKYVEESDDEEMVNPVEFAAIAQVLLNDMVSAHHLSSIF
jgi:hypothetical protein